MPVPASPVAVPLPPKSQESHGTHSTHGYLLDRRDLNSGVHPQATVVSVVPQSLQRTT
jgi:hypothetical protein